MVGRTNLTNFRASECRAELVRAMPSAAENLKANFRASERRAELVQVMPSAAEIIELVKIRATYKVAIISTLCYSCIFLDIFGCARHSPSKLALCTRLHENS